MKPSVIVVTGRAGSGKSELTKRIARAFRFASRNVGDELRRRLRDKGVALPERRQTGEVFFRHFGLQDYVTLVVELMRPNTVIDGVRLQEALQFARSRTKFVQIHRPSRHEDGEPERRGLKCVYESPSSVLASTANVEVAWAQRPEDLDEIVWMRVACLVQLPSQE